MDPKSTFIKRFGDLVALLRADPGNDAAQELALSAAAAAVAHEALRVEAGGDGNLAGRMLAREVDALSIAAGAPLHELQTLARALAHDVTPIHGSLHIEVELIRLLARPPESPEGDGPPGGASRRRGEERRRHDERRRAVSGRRPEGERRHGGDRRLLGERRLFLVKDQRAEVARLLGSLGRWAEARAWEDVLNSLCTLVRMVPRIPLAERNGFVAELRRAMSGRLILGIVELSEREYGVRERATEVFLWAGRDAVEAILTRLKAGEALGVRVFFYDVVGRMPAAYSLVAPMLRSDNPHEVRHGATLLGRLALPEGADLLRPVLDHPDDLVRNAAVISLGELHTAPVVEDLRHAIRHYSARTRVAAAQAITTWRGGELAGLLAEALQGERDRETWQAMITALGMIGTPQACEALATIAVTRRSILRRRGYTTGQRLAAVTALSLAENPVGHTTLERLARENDGVISYAAGRLLQAEGLRVG